MGTLELCARSMRRVLPRCLLVLPIAFLGLAAGVDHSSARAGGSAPEVVRAMAARTISLHLIVSSRATNHKGNVVNEQGSFSGTLSGTLSSHFVAITSTEGAATVTTYMRGGGTLVFRVKTRGRVNGATVSFSGTATIVGGTGRWAHASATGVRFSGTMDRQNLRVTASLTGTLHA
jgi:hypothetical protein